MSLLLLCLATAIGSTSTYSVTCERRLWFATIERKRSDGEDREDQEDDGEDGEEGHLQSAYV